jgi:hypothetical protein
MTEYLQSILNGICDHANDLTIVKTNDERGVLLTISNVHRDDIGRIIGAQGAHIKAIRTLLRIRGAKEHARVSIRVVDPEGRGSEEHGQV